MLSRIRSRLTFANVMSCIAVFLALGGGAWATVAGNGTVQGANRSLPNGDSWVTVETLPGLGRIQAFCESATSGHLGMRFKNLSDRRLVMTVSDSVEGSETQTIEPGGASAFTRNFEAEATGFAAFEVHVFKAGGGTPVGTAAIRAQGQPCHIAVQALTGE